MKKTKHFVLTAFFALLGWEIYTLSNKEKNDTISETVWDWSKKMPLVPFSLGLLMGHFFWQRVPKDEQSDLKK